MEIVQSLFDDKHVWENVNVFQQEVGNNLFMWIKF